MELDRLNGSLEGILKEISLRLKLFFALEFILVLALASLVALLGGLFAQYAQEDVPYLPFFYYLGSLIFLVWVFLRGIWRIASILPRQAVARGVEERFPRLKDDVTNALLLYQQVKGAKDAGRFSRGLVAAHLKKAVGEVSRIDSKKVVRFKGILPRLLPAMVLLFALATVMAIDARPINRSVAYLFHPFAALPEEKTSIYMEPAPSIVLRGTPLVIRARVSGNIPPDLSLDIWPENGEPIRVDMQREGGDRFAYRVSSVQRSFRYQAVGRRTSSPGYFVRAVDAPDINKIKLTLTPPAYTRLPEETQAGGHIEALKGTAAKIEIEATQSIRAGKLILNRTDHIPLKIEKDRLEGRLLVFYPGSYSLWIKDELGFENIDPVQYRVHLIPDKYPQGEIVSPAEDIQLPEGSKILPLVYAAKDDFGVASIRLIYQKGGTEHAITLNSPGDTRKVEPALFEWDLTKLALAPGDRVVYRLEVWDNDSISGPKAGYSRTFNLYLRDEKDLAAQEMARAQKIEEALLHLLADHLEEIKDRRALSEEIDRIKQAVDEHLERMGMEKVERFDLESLRRNLVTLNKRIDSLPTETITQELERLALLAENLLKKTRMREVESLAREIQDRQKRLLDTLKDYKGPLTPEDRQALLKELDKLKSLISEVMEAMSKMAQQLPDEFMNAPELGELDFRNMFQDLADIQEKLRAGDLAGALEAARRLMESLRQMMAAMESAGAQAGMGASGRLQSEMSRQANELEKILAEQKKILNGTETVAREIQRLIGEETEKRLADQAPRMAEALEQLNRRLPSEQEDSILEIKRLLEAGQIEKFFNFVESLERELSNEPEFRPYIDELKEIVRKLVPVQREVMPPDSGQEFPGLSTRQQALEKRTRGLGEALEMLAQLFPGMDTEIITDLKSAATSMDSAAGKLNSEDASGAIPPEMDAIRRLTRSQQATRQMAQQMARQMAMQRQVNRWGYPWGYDPRYGWYYGPGIPLPTLPQPEVKRPLEKGYTGIDEEEFDPPGKDAYKVPRIFRDQIMEALKEDIPSQYRREVERYFKGLTE